LVRPERLSLSILGRDASAQAHAVQNCSYNFVELPIA
jgi:hypothetical protein